MEESHIREYYLNDILAAKHYPQVLRVTKPYMLEGREYLKQGQYITILDRRRIELITGEDQEKRPFKVRNDRSDRSAIVEVVEPDRIAHSLLEVAAMADHIQGIEICKELRFDKITFHVAERLKIEKIGKSFRGRRKNINLRRESDDKVYRFPLDVLGSFKLIASKTKLPITKLMNLRTLPLSAQFRNTPTSSNFPSGVVTVKEMTLCDIVYILTVQEETYTYEAFSVQANIYVEKCNLTIPRPILKLVPNGMYVNSSDFIQYRQKYKAKLADIDSKLIEDIYAPGYYGSATYEKNRMLDDHLLDNVTRTKRASTSLSLDETYDQAMRTLSEFSSNPSTPDSDKSATFPTAKVPPEVLPRHSKNRQKEKRQTMTAIHEFDWSAPRVVQKSASDGNIVASEASTPVHQRHMSTTSGEQTDGTDDEALDLPTTIGSGSNRSNSSNRSRLSDRFETHPNKFYNTPLDDHELYFQNNQNKSERLAGRIYEIPNDPTSRLVSPTSSVANEDSGDSGIVLNFHPPSSPFYKGSQSDAADDHEYAYTLPRKLDIVSTQTTLTTAKPQHQISVSEASVHQVHVDIDISSDSNNNTLKGSSNLDSIQSVNSVIYNSSTQPLQQPMAASTPLTHEPLPPLQPRIPTQDQPGHRSDDYVNSTFINQTISKRMEEIRGLSQDEIGILLKCLNLSRYSPMFSSELINGDLLLELDETTLVNDLSMTAFDARKLFKYVHGWRPVMSCADDSDFNGDTDRWSVNTVVNELLKIKLPLLARFCKECHVDGSLLVDIVGGNILNSLKADHDVTLSGIESSRLKAFVLKKWRPDTQTQPEKSRRMSQQERSFSSNQQSFNNDNAQRQVMTASTPNVSNANSQDRDRSNSAEKRRAGSFWNRIKAV